MPPHSKCLVAMPKPPGQGEDPLPLKWAGTTPLGNEIIRKKLHALEKRLAQEQGWAVTLAGTFVAGQLGAPDGPAGNSTVNEPKSTCSL